MDWTLQVGSLVSLVLMGVRVLGVWGLGVLGV